MYTQRYTNGFLKSANVQKQYPSLIAIFFFWSLSQMLNGVRQQNRLSSSSTSKDGTICSAEPTSCSPAGASWDDHGRWNHG